MKAITKRLLAILITVVILITAIPTGLTAGAESVDPNTNVVYSPCVGYTRVWDSKYPCEGDLVIPEYYGGLPVTEIHTMALNYTNITSVVIPDTVTTLGLGYNFDGCRQMKSAVISNNLYIIPNYAFANCDVLESVTFGKNVSYIYSNAFSFCPKLKYIELPSTITEIRSYAFSHTPLECAFFDGSVIQWENAKIEDSTILDSILYEPVVKSVTSDLKGAKITSEERPGAAEYIFYRQELVNGNWTAQAKIGTSKTESFVDTTAVAGHTYRYAVQAANGPYITRISNSKEFTYEKISSVKLSATAYTYDGNAKNPSVIIKTSDGKTLKTGTDYTVKYDFNCKNAGTHKVTVNMQGNYSGTKVLTYKVNPAKTSKFKFNLSAKSFYYDGKTKTPKITVKNAKGEILQKNKDYKVTYAKGRKNVGTYKVTIKMKGNYTGTKTLTFKINPAKTTVSKLTAGKKSITVAIAKKSAQVTGYEIQYATNKKFNSAKTKIIKNYKTNTLTLKKLAAKKTYYVRVRTYKTVGKTKYYSGWSTYKYVKTK